MPTDDFTYTLIMSPYMQQDTEITVGTMEEVKDRVEAAAAQYFNVPDVIGPNIVFQLVYNNRGDSSGI